MNQKIPYCIFCQAPIKSEDHIFATRKELKSVWIDLGIIRTVEILSPLYVFRHANCSNFQEVARKLKIRVV